MTDPYDGIVVGCGGAGAATAPDEDFVIDRVGRITVGVGLGGHGFKFLPVLGRRLAELAAGTPRPENPFGFERRRRPDGARHR